MIRIVAAATIDFSLIQAWLPIKSKGGWRSSPYVYISLMTAVHDTIHLCYVLVVAYSTVNTAAVIVVL